MRVGWRREMAATRLAIPAKIFPMSFPATGKELLERMRRSSRRVTAFLFLLTALALAGCHARTGSQPAAAASGGRPRCTTAIGAGARLPGEITTTALSQPQAYAVIASPEGSWAFASLRTEIDVLRLSGQQRPELSGHFTAPRPPLRNGQEPLGTPAALGEAITPNGRWLVVADYGWGADVVSVAAAERGSADPVIGQLAASAGLAGATEVAVSTDSRYAFVSLQLGQKIVVYNLSSAIAGHFGKAGYVGSIPTRPDPVGLAISPDGKWLYAVSEGNRDVGGGTLSVISVVKAEIDPATAVVATVTAGCNPVRVITSANGSVVWVTARGSDAVLAFSASRLLTDPGHSLLADVRVGEAPVGMAVVRHGTLLVVGDSNRFDVTGRSCNLAIISIARALAGRTALLGYLPVGQFPRDMTLGPDGQLLVASYGAGQVDQVNTASFPN
jgi:DNA-binding beta-propeller fold protein YncE